MASRRNQVQKDTNIYLGTHKNPPPPKYKGETKDDACHYQILRVKRWLNEEQSAARRGVEILEREKITIVRDYLEGTPTIYQQLEEMLLDANHPEARHTLDQFFDGLTSRYSAPDSNEQRHKKFEELRQTRLAQEYGRKLQELGAIYSPSKSSYKIIRTFRRGLKLRIQEQMDMKLMTLESVSQELYFTTTVQIDTVLFKKERS